MTGDPVPLTRVSEVSLLALLPSLPQLHRRHWKHRRRFVSTPYFFIFFYHVRAVLNTVRELGTVSKSRWPSWAPVPNKPTVSVDVKQHFIIIEHSAGTGFIVCIGLLECWLDRIYFPEQNRLELQTWTIVADITFRECIVPVSWDFCGTVSQLGPRTFKLSPNSSSPQSVGTFVAQSAGWDPGLLKLTPFSSSDCNNCTCRPDV